MTPSPAAAQTQAPRSQPAEVDQEEQSPTLLMLVLFGIPGAMIVAAVALKAAGLS